MNEIIHALPSRLGYRHRRWSGDRTPARTFTLLIRCNYRRWDPVSPEQPALWGSWIELGEAFHEAIIAAPIPVDLRALQALKNSPPALDLYAWATYKTYSVNRSGKPAKNVPWRSLQKRSDVTTRTRVTSKQRPRRDSEGPSRLSRLPGGRVSGQPGRGTHREEGNNLRAHAGGYDRPLDGSTTGMSTLKR